MIKGYSEKLDNLYKQIKQNNLKEQSRRKNYVLKIHPKIIETDKKIALLSLRMLKCKNKSQIEDLKFEIKELRNKKYTMLNSIGLPQDYLDIIYTCNKCKDTGYIITKKCSCFYKNLSNIYLEESDLKIFMEKNNFDNFDFSYFSKNIVRNYSISPEENIKNIYRSILNFIKNFDNINTNLLFTGECGSGKTFLSHCIAKDLLEKGYLVIYKTSEDLFSELHNYYSFKSSDFSKKIEDSVLMQCDLLIIDDLGTESPNNFYYSYFFNFLNKKIILGKKILISTNFALKDLQHHYSDRISSRIFGNFSIFNFFVEQDIRIQKKINGRRVQ